jgi:hypothetical protein
MKNQKQVAIKLVKDLKHLKAEGSKLLDHKIKDGPITRKLKPELRIFIKGSKILLRSGIENLLRLSIKNPLEVKRSLDQLDRALSKV